MVDRWELIAALIRAQGEVTISELHKQFPNVSEMTLRRDLEHLEKSGKIIRVYGGAKSLEAIIGLTEERYAQRSLERVEQKNLIASKAVSLLKPDTSVFIDSGTTTTAFARALPDLNLRIITSGLTCALELARLQDSEVEVIGGTFNKHSLSTAGCRAIEQLQNVNFDIGFLGATGLDVERGFTTGLSEDCELKRAAIKRCAQVVLLVDSSKLGKVHAYTFARLEDVDYMVTDGELPAEILTEIKRKGVDVL